MEKKTHKNEGEKNVEKVWRETATEIEEKTERRKTYRIRRRTWSELCLTDLAVSFWHPPPPMRSFSSFMSQKEARLKMKGYTSQSPSPRSGERRRSPLQGPCCYSKAPAIVWAPIQAYCCAEISRAPFGSLRLQRHAADPLVVLGSDTWLDRCVAPATITTGCGPLPSLPKHSIILVSVVHVSRTLSGQHFYSFLSPPFVLLLSFLLGVYAYCSLEHPHYTHGYILRASLFDFGLMGSEWWAGGSCRAGPALRAPQPASRRVGLGVLSGLGTTGAATSAGGCMWGENWKVNNEGRTKKKREKRGWNKRRWRASKSWELWSTAN